MIRNYYKLNADNIVIETLQTTYEAEKGFIECDELPMVGTRWNGKTFEEVPTEEVEVPEITEVTNADLLEVLLAIGEKVGA